MFFFFYNDNFYTFAMFLPLCNRIGYVNEANCQLKISIDMENDIEIKQRPPILIILGGKKKSSNVLDEIILMLVPLYLSWILCLIHWPKYGPSTINRHLKLLKWKCDKWKQLNVYVKYQLLESLYPCQKDQNIFSIFLSFFISWISLFKVIDASTMRLCFFPSKLLLEWQWTPE